MLTCDRTLALLKEAGIPVVDSVFVPTEVGRDTDALFAAQVAAAASVFFRRDFDLLGVPPVGNVPEKYSGDSVVLKLFASGFSHKSDSGFVALDLRGEEAVRESAMCMLSRVPEDCHIEGFLVQPMIRGGREVFIGAQLDAQFGPVIAFGPGGILVELLNGTDFLRPPFGKDEALLFIKRNAVFPLLSGVRGEKPADIGAIATTLVRLGEFMLANDGIVESVDLNPFLAFGAGSGGFALDARIKEADA